MKKTFYIASLTAIITLSLPAATLAQATTSPTASTKKAAAVAANVTRLQTKADNEINRRVKALQNVLTVIGNMKKLSSSSQTELTSGVQSEIDSLNTLKTKIDADTDITTLRTDVKSIVDSYRIFALYIPKVHIIASADVELTIVDQLTTLSNKLDTRLAAAKTAGKDTATLETALADMKTQITDAKTKATDTENVVMPLTPAGYPDNKATLKSARMTLDEAHKSLQAARQDAEKIVTGLKAFEKAASPSPAVSPTP